MDRQTFIHKAGGVFRSHKGWSWLTSREKRLHFWQFYQKHHPNSQTVYGQFPIHQLLHSKSHSIEHIIPCSVLKSKLKGTMFRGASLNPFNLIPSHQRLNQLRSSFNFDLDEDPVIDLPSLLSKRRKSHTQSGFDAEKEWVVPPRSRGDIARSILYMKLCYPLDSLYSSDHDTLVEWAQKDVPSKVERDYNGWVMARWSIQNPLIDEPELLTHPKFKNTLTEPFTP